ncbi:hypothetical protein GCM10009676_46440 [Prauserella halophila]|uniref:Enoyl-ACP reductase-like protein n=1 Tax=Prauserella halophila TaxID=185641 RepID=A0ABN1WMS6_9PSEU
MSDASWTLHRGMAGGSLYAATKAAVHNLAHTLAAELGPQGIRVNSVSPGHIETPMFHENVDADAHTAVIDRRGRRVLASPAASYINGQDLVIDGGLVAAA